MAGMETTPGTNKPEPLLTKSKLWAVFFVQLNEAYQITVLLPMVVFMVRDFGISSKVLGIYTSIMNASFCFCQFLCCYAWGLISDRYGRRSSLVFGLVFSTIAIVLLGFAKSFATAIVARCISGFFNGNLGVIKAYLADVTDASNRAFAFSTLAISYGFGSVLGSMCGGILIETHDVDVPDEEYIPTTSILKFWIFESEYPFLAPCVLGAVISANALLWTLCHVRDEKLVLGLDTAETNSSNAGYNSLEHHKADQLVIHTLEEREGFQFAPKSLNELSVLGMFQTMPGDGIHSIDIECTRSLMTPRGEKDHQALLMRSLKERESDNDDQSVEEYSSVWSLVFDTKLYHGLAIWTMLIMAFMMYQEVCSTVLCNLCFLIL